MPARGVQYLPIRYPREAPAWFATFMDAFVKDVLTNMDVRNATPGAGIEITGTPDTPATITSSEDVQQLKDENYILAEASEFLANSRVIDGENGVVRITDEGPGGLITISLFEGGIPYSKLGDIDELSVLGNPTDAFGSLTRISGTAQHEVLSVQLNGSDLEVRFGTITHESVSDFTPAVFDALSAVTFITESDETADLPGSRQLVAGPNITLDTTTPGEIEISASGGGGSTLVGSATVIGSAATSITVSGLDLDAAGRYLVVVEAKNATGSNGLLYVMVNGDTTPTNYYTQRHTTDGATNLSGRANEPGVTELLAGAVSQGYGYYTRDLDGYPRLLFHTSLSSPSTIRTYNAATVRNVTGNVTSVTLMSSMANGLAVGTSIKIYLAG